MKTLLTLSRLLLPRSCVLCKAITENNYDLCTPCKTELPWISNACPCCAAELPTGAATCGNCANTSLPFQATHALFRYQQPIPKMMLQLKFQQKLVYANILGQLLLQSLLHRDYSYLPDAIIPIPLHSKRLRQRGFNQAVEIARPVANGLQVPLLKYQYYRNRNTPAQSSISAKLRKRNIRGAFSGRSAQSLRHVAIVDDVVTTGNTVGEFASFLRQQGIKYIEVWCCVKT